MLETTLISCKSEAKVVPQLENKLRCLPLKTVIDVVIDGGIVKHQEELPQGIKDPVNTGVDSNTFRIRIVLHKGIEL